MDSGRILPNSAGFFENRQSEGPDFLVSASFGFLNTAYRPHGNNTQISSLEGSKLVRSEHSRIAEKDEEHSRSISITDGKYSCVKCGEIDRVLTHNQIACNRGLHI
jgi:hypothetical protein